MIIGLTTGFLYDSSIPCEKQEKSISQEMIKKCKKLGCNAIELNCIGGFYDTSLRDLARIDKKDLLGFEHVSIHAPCKGAIFTNNKKTKQVLRLLEAESKRLGINLVVFHPDSIDDWEVFEIFDMPIAIENLDNRKKTFKNIEDMKKAFKLLPNCKFVLDVNHCKTNDSSMKLAQDFIDNFKDRLAEIHVSGFQDYHYPIYKTKQIEILDAIPDSNIPMIIESCCNSLKEAKKEIVYIKNYFQKR